MTRTVAFKTGTPLLSPAFQDMIDRCVDLMKLDIVQGLAYEQEPALMAARGLGANPSRLAPIVAARLRKARPGGKRGRSAAAATALPLDQIYDSAIRSLARRHNIDLAAPRAVLKQIDAARDFGFLVPDITDPKRLASLQENLFTLRMDSGLPRAEGEALRRLAPQLSLDPTVLRLLAESGRLAAVKPGLGGQRGDKTPPIVANKGMHFLLHQVKCIDETNPEWPGSDEIAMGGTAVAPAGDPVLVPEFFVRDEFDDGESKTYDPPKVLATFGLEGLSYPADFLMIVALAEKDNGGMSAFLRDLWEAIKDQVQTIITVVGAAAGAVVGSAVGGTIGTAIGGPLGTIIGVATGAILGALVGWLISVSQDDIFTPQSAAVHLPSPDASFEGGVLTSPQFTLDFSDHGGQYRVSYSWQLVR
jgi:hypothetical protein